MESGKDLPGAMEDALRRSWEVHRQAFGPILEPAYAENPQVRVTLIAALNHLSRRQIKRGMELLGQIKEHCLYDEDKAAWTFFVGLGFEMAGAKAQMLQWYAEAGRYHHRFYLPYLKLAKACYGEKRYAEAKEYYETAIECLLEMPERDKDPVILGAAYTNLTGCLTVLRQYREAEAAWRQALQYPTQPAAAATGAILYAALGDLDRAEGYLETLDREMAEQTRAAIRQILGEC